MVFFVSIFGCIQYKKLCITLYKKFVFSRCLWFCLHYKLWNMVVPSCGFENRQLEWGKKPIFKAIFCFWNRTYNNSWGRSRLEWDFPCIAQWYKSWTCARYRCKLELFQMIILSGRRPRCSSLATKCIIFLKEKRQAAKKCLTKIVTLSKQVSLSQNRLPASYSSVLK